MSKGKILIIDDNIETSLVLKMRLEFEDYNVELAYDGKEGVEKANKHNPDLILLDIMMPGVDGFAVCAKLRNTSKTKDIPIIMVTAKTLMGDVEQAFKKGADSYIMKPFEIEELIEKIEKYIKK